MGRSGCRTRPSTSAAAHPPRLVAPPARPLLTHDRGAGAPLLGFHPQEQEDPSTVDLDPCPRRGDQPDVQAIAAIRRLSRTPASERAGVIPGSSRSARLERSATDQATHDGEASSVDGVRAIRVPDHWDERHRRQRSNGSRRRARALRHRVADSPDRKAARLLSTLGDEEPDKDEAGGSSPPRPTTGFTSGNDACRIGGGWVGRVVGQDPLPDYLPSSWGRSCGCGGQWVEPGATSPVS
jgi:hypothetical protein